MISDYKPRSTVRGSSENGLQAEFTPTVGRETGTRGWAELSAAPYGLFRTK